MERAKQSRPATFWRRTLAAMTALAASGCSIGSPSLSPADATGSITKREAAAQNQNADAPLPATPGKAKVALLLPLSGPGNVAAIAKAMKQAGEMAVLERAQSDFQLIVKDDKATPEGAKAAAEEALREGAELILGPLLATSVEAVAPVAAAQRVPVIAFSNDRRVLRPGTFLMSFMPEQDVERIVSYAIAQGKRTYAALLPDDAYGRIVEDAFTSAVGRAQGNVVAIERYGRGASSGMLDATRKLGDAINNPTSDGTSVTADAVLIPGDPDVLASIGPLIAYARIDPTRVKLLGTGGWDAPNIGRDITFVGAWYPAPDPRGWQAFSEKFAGMFGANPPRIASIAFDAVGVAMALSGAPSALRFTAQGITRAGGFQTTDGTVKFLADGTAVRSLAIHEVQSVGSRLIEPAEAGGGQASGRAPSASAPSARRPEQLN